MARELCEEAGISWMDLSGNARIIAPGLRIVIEGKPNAFPSRGRPATVFAPRSARVARHLLLDPARRWKQLELAQGTGLDDGSVSRIVRRLVEDRLLVRDDDNTLRVPDPSKLLDAWAADYDFTRHTIRAGHITATSGQALLERIVKSLDGRAPYAATGLAAAASICSGNLSGQRKPRRSCAHDGSPGRPHDRQATHPRRLHRRPSTERAGGLPLPRHQARRPLLEDIVVIGGLAPSLIVPAHEGHPHVV